MNLTTSSNIVPGMKSEVTNSSPSYFVSFQDQCETISTLHLVISNIVNTAYVLLLRGSIFLSNPYSSCSSSHFLNCLMVLLYPMSNFSTSCVVKRTFFIHSFLPTLYCLVMYNNLKGLFSHFISMLNAFNYQKIKILKLHY